MQILDFQILREVIWVFYIALKQMPTAVYIKEALYGRLPTNCMDRFTLIPTDAIAKAVIPIHGEPNDTQSSIKQKIHTQGERDSLAVDCENPLSMPSIQWELLKPRRRRIDKSVHIRL